MVGELLREGRKKSREVARNGTSEYSSTISLKSSLLSFLLFSLLLAATISLLALTLTAQTLILSLWYLILNSLMQADGETERSK